MRICYISHNYKMLDNAGGKAKADIEQTLVRMGAINLGWRQTHYKNSLLHFIINFTGVLRAMMRIKRGDVIVLQYPLKKYYEMICRAAHRRGAQVVTIVHDLNSFRSQRLTVPQEMARLGHSDVVIVHNQKMHDWLKENGCKAKLEILGIFDYLSPHEVTSKREQPDFSNKDYRFSVFFVGKLTRTSNHFVYDLGKKCPNTPFYLYGTNFAADLLPQETKTEFLGFAKDYKLMENNRGDFGLSWYGDSLTHGSGRIGEYMAFNNPHKVSLYLRCDVPVILWKNAGIASFIEENGCGILVDSLENLEETLAGVTEKQYIRMLENVRRVSRNLARGHYFESALRRAIAQL